MIDALSDQYSSSASLIGYREPYTSEVYYSKKQGEKQKKGETMLVLYPKYRHLGFQIKLANISRIYSNNVTRTYMGLQGAIAIGGKIPVMRTGIRNTYSSSSKCSMFGKVSAIEAVNFFYRRVGSEQQGTRCLKYLDHVCTQISYLGEDCEKRDKIQKQFHHLKERCAVSPFMEKTKVEYLFVGKLLRQKNGSRCTTDTASNTITQKN
ncbi:hypothetical protein PHYBLDRAFT_169500 [Phycomyces blakesleeanus NRRL 1555(-)]|uniref:Uncharacterized protein n=1 Tax=Phycomyces blakesleeanus (strain ATCC 8743b / DSM 1359 / FGSC 10004 / NBRC 33097 / NRRL 1555) TaxID=763407 RepID=A0A162U4Y1_PHYB8|nr:hypothetical protein PHYBLDRAFT_169500 [Phycomyces blakesleeanus NRRL 1555(-)]OAD72363.1 hypothetical protein PHYBLDRAFT_169500 [Phycomyces blakesleeanus NRRL 1555(-)]|eukprot:XP_018290403.1 hypothetical protein PHYBLDRAFT_169500 [Phycomyces blakesleeanus NRRL 1555(-)]